MKYLSKLIILVTVLVAFGSIQNADGGTLSARLGKKGISFSKRCPAYRVNDCGKPKRKWRQQVTYRAVNDTFIYRNEGRASVREEEVAGQAMIFHTKCDGKLGCGHVFQRRDN